MSRDPGLSCSLEIALTAAREAGAKMLVERHGLVPDDIAEKGPNDFVTRVDREIEELIRFQIGEAYPADGFFGEEGGGLRSNLGRQWLVDPIDGTTNFIRGIPFSCVSIGLAVEGTMQVGVIYDPVHDEMFSCLRGRGAWLNGKDIVVSSCAEIKRALIATGFPSRFKENMQEYLEQFGAVSRVAAGMRRAGSAALDLAYVACGRFDAFWEPRLSAWDMAAGALMVEMAQGMVADDRAQAWTLDARGIIAANRPIYADFIRLLAPNRV